MEYGQPLHAFDKDLLDGSEIIVRRAVKDEAFTSLNGIELKLDEDTLVIADTSKAIALAGIMGGANSQVKETTRNIILESASFDSVIVRKGSKKYGLRSDSSIRFERGVDIKGMIAAQIRAALLIKKLAGGIISKGRVDVYPLPLPNKVIFLRVSRLNEVLGCCLSVDHIENLLFRLGMKASKQKDGESFSVEIPSFRPFLTREIDLIEEAARLNGFDKIKVTSPSAKISPVRFTSKQLAIRDIKNLLSHTGFSEVLTYSFIGKTIAKQFQSAFSRNCEVNPIALKNPISSDMAVMRPSLLPGLIDSLVRNFSKGQKQVKVFEFGNVFISSKENAYEERMIFAGLAAGTHENNVWEQTGSSYDYFDLKGVLDSVTRFLKLNLTEQPGSELPYMLMGKNVRLMANGQDCGYFGELSPSIVRLYELPRHCIVFELDFDTLIHSRSKKVSFLPLPKFPETFRDISILIDKTVASGEVMSKISQIGEPLLSKVELYDHFEGKRIQEGKKSLTYALTFQSNERTLVDEEINPIFDEMVKTLWSQFGATLRE
jgi:phenylalanyl-tRNA synthetase beta chain